MFLNQLFGSRPVPSWSDYRAPVEGLYLCGAGMHPGGAVNGAAGHNAAKVVLKDLGMDDRDPDSAAAEPERASARPSQGLTALEQAYSHQVMRRVGIALAKQRWTRPLGRFLTRGRSS